MRSAWIAVALSVGALFLIAATPRANSDMDGTPNAPSYTAEGYLKFPGHYGEWVYVTSSVDISYGANTTVDHSAFDNVFVNPEAYRSFLQMGTWPDKTILVFEVRKAGSSGSSNKARHFQTDKIVGRQLHVKDETRFPGKWAFFDSEDGVAGKLLPRESDCYSRHEQHGAVDTTFVQSYPTLLDIAKRRNTLSPAYLKEEAGKQTRGACR